MSPLVPMVVEQTLHSLAHQGIQKDMYLRIAGKTEEELLEEAKPDAERALRREAVLTAVVAAEGIEISDDDVLEALAEGEQDAKKPKKLFEQLRSQGRIDSIKEDLAARRAVETMVDSAQAISVEQAQARDKLWTPEKTEEQAAAPQLWTPGG